MNFAPVVGIAVIIYQLVFLLFHAAAIYARSAISVFATTALIIQSVRKYGEGR